jgi:hypothetical protein
MFDENGLGVRQLPAEPRVMQRTAIHSAPSPPHLWHMVLPEPRVMQGWPMHHRSDTTKYRGTLGMEYRPHEVLMADSCKAIMRISVILN